jgi:hypothetical protein
MIQISSFLWSKLRFKYIQTQVALSRIWATWSKHISEQKRESLTDLKATQGLYLLPLSQVWVFWIEWREESSFSLKYDVLSKRHLQ